MVDQAAIRRQIAAGLRRARRRAGKSQDDVAEAIAMSKSGLQHLEMARHSLRVEQLPAFAKAIGCTVRELLVEMRLVRERRQPGTLAGPLDGGSAVGDRSTAHDPRGDTDPPHRTAEPEPVQ